MQNTSVFIGVLSNDTDDDPTTLAISSVDTPSNGTATVFGTAIYYSPAADFTGSDAFEYTVCDDFAECSTATITVDVTATNCTCTPASTATAPVGIVSNVCSQTSAIAEDSLGAGIAYDGLAQVAGVHVTGCLQLDFDAVQAVDAVRLSGRGVPSVCGTSCTSPYCGTGNELILFTGETTDTYEYKGVVPLANGTFTPDQVSVDADAQYLLVCRTGSGPARNQIELDFAELCECEDVVP
jgi:hypothetical protein